MALRAGSSDSRSGRPYDEPEAAELVDVLAEDLQRLAVTDVVVERLARVGHLPASVASPDRAEQRGGGAAALPSAAP